MKKLGKLNLKQMEQEMPVIETMEQMKIFGGCVSSYVWHSWSDSQKAQYIIDTYRNGGVLNIEGLSASGWSTNQCGASVNINGQTFQVIVSVSSLANTTNLSQFGYYNGNMYQNSCGSWTTGYVGGYGNNQWLMMNPASNQTSSFSNAINPQSGSPY